MLQKYVSRMVEKYGNQWVEALDSLMKKHGWSVNRLERERVMHRSQYNTMMHSVAGPTTETLAKILNKIGSSWQEWGEACERIKPLHLREFKQIKPRSEKGGSGNTYEEKARKVS